MCLTVRSPAGAALNPLIHLLHIIIVILEMMPASPHLTCTVDHPTFCQSYCSFRLNALVKGSTLSASSFSVRIFHFPCTNKGFQTWSTESAGREKTHSIRPCREQLRTCLGHISVTIHY